MNSPDETRRPTPAQRRTTLRWLVALLVLIVVGFVLRGAFPDETWVRIARTVVAVLTGAVMIGSLVNTVKIHREMTQATAHDERQAGSE